MAIGPRQLLEPNERDWEAIRTCESFVDGSPQFQNYVSGDIRVVIPKNFIDILRMNRERIRVKNLLKLYEKAGWRYVSLTDNVMLFSETDPSAGHE